MDASDPALIQSARETDRGPAERHELRELDEVVDRLVNRFPQIPEDRIWTLVGTEHRRFDGSPIRDFVSVLVERAARATLDGSDRSVADVSLNPK